MLTFNGHKLYIIKQAHNEFMGGLNVIMTNGFNQASIVQNSWISNQ